MKATPICASDTRPDEIPVVEDHPVDHVVYEVTLRDRTVERIDGADAYLQEGTMTTFFRTARDRHVVDTWSTRMASFRTSEITSIRRREGGAGGPHAAPGAPTLRSA